MQMNDLFKPAIILCEPQSPGNIGSVARAMANFGSCNLRLISPCDHLHPEALKFAVGAVHLLESATIYPDLSTAVSDLEISIATTRREGGMRGSLIKSSQLHDQLLATLTSQTRLGLIFGREDSGLTSDEISLCSHVATVSTSDEQGSLNLAQAVLLFLYEIARESDQRSTTSNFDRPTQGELNGLLDQIHEVLDRVAFLNPSKPGRTLHRLKQLTLRANPDRKEVALLRGMWSQLASSINDWRGRRKGNNEIER
jgi:tRNA/rRNA methyltransferase